MPENSFVTKYPRLFAWTKLVAFTGGAQIVVQAIGFISGILIIRLLSTQEYAYYILANTVLGTMTVLADGGIGTGVMAQGAKVWKDRYKLGAVLATGIKLRKRFAKYSLLVSIPILFYLLIHNDASWPGAVLISLTLIPAFYASLRDSILDIIPKLHQSILPLQKNQMAVGFGRLLLSGLSLVIFPYAYMALLANGIPRLIGNIKLRKIANNFAEEKSPPDPQVQSEILKIVKKYMPGAIYFSLSGQITLWIISIFGNATSIAEIGALGRFSIILSLISTITGTIIVPRFARLVDTKSKILQSYILITALLFGLMAFIILVTYIFPNQILWILGGDYKHLQFELMLTIVGACVGVLSDIAFSLLSSRGWMYNPILYIGVNIISIILMVIFLDITSVVGVLWMAILINLILYLMNILIFLYNNQKS